MVVFTALTWAASALMPGFAGSLSILGMSPAVTAAVISVGRGLAWSLASAALTRQKVPSQQVQATLSQTDAPRVRGYGRLLLGGQRAFFEAKDGRLHQIVVCHHGRVDGLIRFWWDGEPVVTASNGEVHRYKHNYFRDGSGVGGDYEDVLEAFPALWTTAHRLQGQATFYTRFGDPSDEDFAKVFPKGPYTVVQAEVRGSRVRNIAGDMVYTPNAALCIRDLMTHPDGWNIPLARLDATSWAQFAQVCDQAIPISAGGTEPRYRLSGTYSLEDAMKDVTARMLATCDGQIYETAEGKIGILGGVWSEPDVTITADDILSIEMQDGFDPFSDYNVLNGSFVSPEHKYQSTPVMDLRDETALLTQEERAEQMDVDMCPSGPQLQRLMKIRWAKDHREHIGTIRTNLVGLKARWPKGDGLHTIRIRAEEFALDGVFEVTSHVFSIPDGYCEIGIASIENPYNWTVAQERPMPPQFDALGRPINTVRPPTNPIIVQNRIVVSGGVQGVKLVVSVDNPGRASLELQAQYAPGNLAANADAPWTGMTAARYRAETGVLDDGKQYTVRVKWRGRGEWIRAGAITAIANPDPPDPPTGLTAIATGGTVSLDWINAPSRFYRTQLYRGATTDFASATLIATVAGVAGEVSDYVDTPSGAGVWRYWAVTINGSGVPSTPMGPIGVTI